MKLQGRDRIKAEGTNLVLDDDPEILGIVMERHLFESIVLQGRHPLLLS